MLVLRTQRPPRLPLLNSPLKLLVIRTRCLKAQKFPCLWFPLYPWFLTSHQPLVSLRKVPQVVQPIQPERRQLRLMLIIIKNMQYLTAQALLERSRVSPFHWLSHLLAPHHPSLGQILFAPRTVVVSGRRLLPRAQQWVLHSLRANLSPRSSTASVKMFRSMATRSLSSNLGDL